MDMRLLNIFHSMVRDDGTGPGCLPGKDTVVLHHHPCFKNSEKNKAQRKVT